MTSLEPDRRCGHCGDEIPSNDKRAKFCSRSCAAKANRNRLGTGRPPQACAWCGQLMVTRSQRNNAYCDRRCMSAHQQQERVAAWLENPNGRDWRLRPDGEPYAAIQVPRFIRRWLIETHGSTACWTCGFDRANPHTGLSVVQVNHRDGDPLNNSPENLERLCPNCHSLTEFHGRRGQGRPTRYDAR